MRKEDMDKIREIASKTARQILKDVEDNFDGCENRIIVSSVIIEALHRGNIEALKQICEYPTTNGLNR